MPVNYDLQCTIDGWLSTEFSDLAAAVSSTIGLYPGYTYQNTEIEPTPTGNIVHIFYIDEWATSSMQAEVVPFIVYAILGTLSVLGIAVIVWSLVEVFKTSPEVIYAGLAIAAVFAIGYLYTSMKGDST